MIVLIMACLVACVSFAQAEQTETEDWWAAPIIKKAYEQSAGKIYVEWEGNAPLYQVYVDGSKRADLIVSHLVIDMTKGTHTILVYPIYELKKDAETKIGLNAAVPLGKIGGDVGLNVDLDLAALGIEAKDLVSGTPSETLSIDYRENPIIEGKAENLYATTDFDNKVTLSFSDQFNADEYEIMIKKNNNANYVTYRSINEEDAYFITKNNALTSVLLDPGFLAKQDCAAPDLDEEYRFSVLMRKYSKDYVTGEMIQTSIHASKQSDEIAYKPTALWKTAPVINFASQTADGEVTLRWNHNDNGLGCEYQIMKINKILGVMTGEDLLGITKEHEFILKDLTNGGYCFNVVPTYNGAKGAYSVDANIEVKNDWVVAPELICEQTGDRQVKLTWKVPANIEQYHITVYTGDNNSLLRFVDLDYSMHTEFDVDATEGNMEYIFTYDKDIDPENGLKIKFDIYGLRHAENGDVQKSAPSSQALIMK